MHPYLRRLAPRAIPSIFALSRSPWAARQAASSRPRVVSGKGADTPACGGVGNPCRTFQYAHDNIVAAGGEIDTLDPAAMDARHHQGALHRQ